MVFVASIGYLHCAKCNYQAKLLMMMMVAYFVSLTTVVQVFRGDKRLIIKQLDRKAPYGHKFRL